MEVPGVERALEARIHWVECRPSPPKEHL